MSKIKVETGDEPEKQLLLHEWEKARKLMILGEVNESSILTENQFQILMEDRGFIGVDQEGRTEFLKCNGYELTRENYMNSELSARISEGSTDEK